MTLSDPARLIEVRCPHCRRLLCRALGSIEIWCRKCKIYVVISKTIDKRALDAQNSTQPT